MSVEEFNYYTPDSPHRPQSTAVVLPTVGEVREAIISGTKLGGWMPHTAAQAVLDLIASRVPVWQPIAPGTVIKAGTRVREDWHDQITEWTLGQDEDPYASRSRSSRYWLDPRTVPAEPVDPRAELLAEELHNHGGCEEVWPRCSVSTVEHYRNDARDLLARLDAVRADA